jgi:UDP-glucose 4-epimerase
MTRFMMTLEDAVELVMYAFERGNNGDIFVQKAPAATLRVLTDAMRQVFDRPSHPVREIGTRHGEKLYESLLSREEFASAEDLGEYFRIPPDGRDLNYEKFVEQGEERITRSGDYTSHTTRQLDAKELGRMLRDLPYIQRALRGEQAEAY